MTCHTSTMPAVHLDLAFSDEGAEAAFRRRRAALAGPLERRVEFIRALAWLIALIKLLAAKGLAASAPKWAVAAFLSTCLHLAAVLVQLDHGCAQRQPPEWGGAVSQGPLAPPPHARHRPVLNSRSPPSPPVSSVRVGTFLASNLLQVAVGSAIHTDVFSGGAAAAGGLRTGVLSLMGSGGLWLLYCASWSALTFRWACSRAPTPDARCPTGPAPPPRACAAAPRGLSRSADLRAHRPPPCMPPSPGRFKFPLLGAASALLLLNTGHVCSNPNFQSSYAVLQRWLRLPTARVCAACQMLAVLVALDATGHWLYTTELRQRQAFLAEAGAEGRAGPSARQLPSALEFWTSFAIPATCCLYSYVAVSCGQ